MTRAGRRFKPLAVPPLVTALLGCSAAAGPAAPRPRFDGARAFADLERQVGFGPRVPGTAPHQRTAEWLEATLEGLGAELAVDRFEAAGMPLVNLMARVRPERTDRVMLFAHWDTRPRADQDPDPALRSRPVPGANDGASGVAVLLELARVFQSAPPPVGVDLVLLDGEDQGTFEASLRDVLLGSQRFARTYRGPRPRFGILLDMVGDRELRIAREQNSVACCRRTVEKVWAVARDLGHGAVFVDADGPGVLDDHIPLNRAGLGVIDLIDFDYRPWHTTRDTPEQTSARSLEIVGEVVAEVIYRERPAPR